MIYESLGCIRQCGRIAKYRGLCHSCYRKSNIAVLAGETTWEKLVECGQANPDKKSWRTKRKSGE